MTVENISDRLDQEDSPKQVQGHADPMAEIAALEATFARRERKPRAPEPVRDVEEQAAEADDPAKQELFEQGTRLYAQERVLEREAELQLRAGELDAAMESIRKMEVVTDAIGVHGGFERAQTFVDHKKEQLFYALMSAQRFEDGARMAASVRGDGTQARLSEYARRSIARRDTERRFETAFQQERGELANLVHAGTPEELNALRSRITTKIEAERATLDPADSDSLNTLYAQSGINEVDDAIRYPRRAAA